MFSVYKHTKQHLNLFLHADLLSSISTEISCLLLTTPDPSATVYTGASQYCILEYYRKVDSLKQKQDSPVFVYIKLC